MKTRRILPMLMMLALVASSSFGCAQLLAALPKIVSAVSDSSLVLDQIQSFVNAYFAARPDPVKAREIGSKLAAARAGLIAAQRGLEGTEKIDQEQTDEAFAAYRDAYKALTEAIAALEGVSASTEPDGRFKAMAKVPSGPVAVGMSAAPPIELSLDVPRPQAIDLKL